MPRAKFQQPGLNVKIKRHANIEEARQKKVNLLILEYGLNPGDFNMTDSSAWRELCLKMAEAIVPGFQERRSGRKPKHTFADDYVIIREYLAYIDFADYVSTVHKKKVGTVIEEIARKYKKSVPQVRTAIARHERHKKAYPELYVKTRFSDAAIVESDLLADAKKTDSQYFKTNKV